EGLQVALQGAGVGSIMEPSTQFLRIMGGQSRVTVLPGQFDDRGGTQPPVEVVVQEYFRRPADLFGCEWLIHGFRMPAHRNRPRSAGGSPPKSGETSPRGDRYCSGQRLGIHLPADPRRTSMLGEGGARGGYH